jgi:AAA15 family ATPase/GTPase
MSVNFVVGENAPDKTSYFKDDTGTRVSLLETVIGPNASGKTNLLKVLPFMKWLLIDSWNENPNNVLLIKPFLTNADHNKVTKLGVVFSIDKATYEYDIHLNKTKIYYERLTERSLKSERRSAKVLFERRWNEDTNSYTLMLTNFNAPPGFQALIRENATAISTALRLNHKLSNQITQYWQKVDFNVKESGYIGDQIFGHHEAMASAVSFFFNNPTLKEKADEIMKKYDLGLSSIDIQRGTTKDELVVSAKHNFGSVQHSISMDYESSGTKKLYSLLKVILSTLDTGGMAILDEFDTSLHPEMVKELVGMFTDKLTNSKNAQLLFCTHNHQILSQLDKYQITLTEKNANGESDTWRLDEMKGIRADDNYFTKYIAGAYGAVPNLG